MYDTKTGTTIDLGEGSGATFSLDSRWAGWLAGSVPPGPFGPSEMLGKATIQNLETGERRTFGEARAVTFVDDLRVAVFPPERGAWKLYDLATGQPSADQTTPGRPGYRVTPKGDQLWVTPVKGSELPPGGWARSTFDLREPSGALILEFQAVAAVVAGPGELVVATPVQDGRTNIFVLHTDTGVADFIATTRYGNGPNWPFSATPSAILWTDAFCSESQGHMQLFDRRSGTLIDIEDSLPPGNVYESNRESDRYGRLTPGGLILQGSFGGYALIDPATMQYVAVLPPVVPTDQPVLPHWSPDYRYASYSNAGGHGGLC